MVMIRHDIVRLRKQFYRSLKAERKYCFEICKILANRKAYLNSECFVHNLSPAHRGESCLRARMKYRNNVLSFEENRGQ